MIIIITLEKNDSNNYYKKHQMRHELVNWFKEFSYETWLRLEFTKRTKSIKTHETTITQNLVYQFFLLSRQFDLPIQIYEAQNEKINGNDIEFAIETEQGYILFPTQAKVIKEKEKYDFITHKVRGIFQIDLLDSYSRKVRGIPLYLFYNFFETELSNEADELESKVDFEVPCYGCSIAMLETIQNFKKDAKWKIPSFWDIHPHNGVPLFQLIQIVGQSLKNCPLFENKNLIEKYDVRFYSEKEILEGFDGKNIAPRPRIGYIPSSKNKKETTFNFFSKPNYQPKFRVVISSNPNFNKFQIGFQGFANQK